jgi:hypothetical protein
MFQDAAAEVKEQLGEATPAPLLLHWAVQWHLQAEDQQPLHHHFHISLLQALWDLEAKLIRTECVW